MKKRVAVWILALWTVLNVSADDVITRNVNQLPSTALKSLQKHFPNQKISYIKIDKEWFSETTYEVVLTDGTEVEFDSKGQWKEVDGKRKAVPEAYIPTSIRAYLKKEFPGRVVTKIDRDRRDYEVELDNGLDLVFDLKGNFLRLDD